MAPRLLLLSCLLASLGTGCVHRVREAELFYPRKAPALSDLLQRRNVEVALPTVLYFYGNGDRLVTAYPRLCALSDRLGMNALCVDYRRYGASDGRPGPELKAMQPLPVQEIARVAAPLLVIQGAEDGIVPAEAGRKVFEAAASRRKRWCLVPGAHHNDLDLDAEPARSALADFLRELGPLS